MVAPRENCAIFDIINVTKIDVHIAMSKLFTELYKYTTTIAAITMVNVNVTPMTCRYRFYPHTVYITV